jgi:membrane protein implicated in regulation of membrane protease activity
MDHTVALVFFGAGIVLVVLEMASLTFYLAALGFAALLTSLVTWFYPVQDWQAAAVFAVASAVTLPLAHLLRHRMQGGKDDPLADMDKGGRVTVAETGGQNLKVRYRDSLWDAVWEGSGAPQVGQPAEVVAREGARLRVRPVN